MSRPKRRPYKESCKRASELLASGKTPAQASLIMTREGCWLAIRGGADVEHWHGEKCRIPCAQHHRGSSASPRAEQRHQHRPPTPADAYAVSNRMGVDARNREKSDN
jgi:hypothetical protein